MMLGIEIAILLLLLFLIGFELGAKGIINI